LWQHAKIRPEGISQSNGSIGHPLGFAIGRLNTSASPPPPNLFLKKLNSESFAAQPMEHLAFGKGVVIVKLNI